MRDFNFFDELDSGKKKKTSFSTYIIGAFLLLFLALVLTSYYYLNLVSELKSDKTAMENQLNDSAHQAAYEEALTLSEEIEQVEAEYRELEEVHMSLLDTRIISSRLMKEIAMAKPDAIAIRFISFTREGISIEGTSLNKDLIAEFEYNLRGNKRFVGPFIPMIQKMEEGEYYSFSLNFTFYYPEIIPEEEDVANGQG